jgi:AraC-like DNA-binding protein
VVPDTCLDGLVQTIMAGANAFEMTQAPIAIQGERSLLLYPAAGAVKVNWELGYWLVPPRRVLWIPSTLSFQAKALGRADVRCLSIHGDALPRNAPVQARMLQVTSLLHELMIRASELSVGNNQDCHYLNVIRTLLGEIDWAAIHPLSLPLLRDERLCAMEAALQCNPGNALSLEEWALRLSTSTRSLSRLFTQEAGMSFIVWRDQMRAAAALPLLAARKPLIDIALELGYVTAWSFTAMFKRVTGQLPSRYFN